MKKVLFALLALLPVVVIGQIPPGYYSSAAGLTGQPLRAALSAIIRPHTQLTYTPGLWNAYRTTDVKPSGKLWDMYSDKPGSTPPYEYTIGSDQCTSVTPTVEGTCYNREHTWPQSKFSSDTPMQTDLFHVIPSDYVVNYERGDNPYGKAGSSIIKTFRNGSKLANNVYPGAPSGTCYEPLDSFKGDLARIYFYMTTCYMNDSNKFINWEPATKVTLKPWAIQMFLEWHRMDPVSKKEIDRNNAAYALQRNRNPFVDHPEYAECIWGTGPCTTTVDEVSSSPYRVWYADHSIHFETQQATQHLQIAIMDATGRLVARPQANSSTFDASTLASGLYIVVLTEGTTRYAEKIAVY